jgi:hypothetical protein
LVFTLVFAGSVGCVSDGTRPKVVVTNAGREPLREVTATAGQALLGRSETLEGNTSFTLPGIPGNLLLSWTDGAGQRHSFDTRLQEHLPPEGARAVYVQIESDQRVRVRLDAKPRRAESDLPWNKMENWEGAPTIPGLNRE